MATIRKTLNAGCATRDNNRVRLNGARVKLADNIKQDLRREFGHIANELQATREEREEKLRREFEDIAESRTGCGSRAGTTQ